MKKILLSLMTITLVLTVTVMGTRAYFTDTEKSAGNTFTTGTIDIAVNGENPWSTTTPFQLVDMKPSTVNYWNFTIKNVGNNTANVWKKLYNFTYNAAPSVTLPPQPTGAEQYDPNIGGVIRYGIDVNNKTLIDELAGYVLDQTGNHTLIGTTPVSGQYICLGMLKPGEEMTVRQSYHMDGSTTNWAQGAQMRFDVDLLAQQVVGGPSSPVTELTGFECKTLDFVDLGNSMSESGHNLSAWSNNQSQVPYNGSNYGGGSSDKTFRLLMGPGDPLFCGTGAEEATFTMEAGSASATKLVLEHLDGQKDDSFDVYVNGSNIYHYTDSGSSETWVTTTIPLSGLSGLITIRLVGTNPANEWCQTYGQLAFSNAVLEKN